MQLFIVKAYFDGFGCKMYHIRHCQSSLGTKQNYKYYLNNILKHRFLKIWFLTFHDFQWMNSCWELFRWRWWWWWWWWWWCHHTMLPCIQCIPTGSFPMISIVTSPIILIPRRIIHLPKNKIIDTCHSIATGVEHALQISLPINVELISVSDKVWQRNTKIEVNHMTLCIIQTNFCLIL